MFLAITLYSASVLLAALAGFVLLCVIPFRRRGWMWKLPLAFALMFGPYLGDTVLTRASAGESLASAAIPTSILLIFLEPDTKWPYGTLFDRLNKAPDRHAMWGWQLNQLAGWCGRCAQSKDDAMVKRGVQIAATLTGKGCDEAIDVLAAALMHRDSAIATLACDALAGAGPRAARARALIENAAVDAPVTSVRQRAKDLLK